MKKLLNKKGFTLIELIVVIAILAILALILIPSLFGYINRANDSKLESNARTAYSAALLEVATNEDAVLEDIELAVKEALPTIAINEDGDPIQITYEGTPPVVKVEYTLSDGTTKIFPQE